MIKKLLIFFFILISGLAFANPPGTYQPLLIGSVVSSNTTWGTTHAAGCILSGGNLIVTGTCTFGGFATTSTNISVYFEAKIGGTIGSSDRIGMADSSWSYTVDELGDGTHSISYNPSSGQVRYNSGSVTTIMTAASGDIISVAWNSSTHKIWFRKNGGLWDNTTDDPALGTGGYNNMTPTGDAFPAYELLNGTAPTWTAAFSQSSWIYIAPIGFNEMP